MKKKTLLVVLVLVLCFVLVGCGSNDEGDYCDKQASNEIEKIVNEADNDATISGTKEYSVEDVIFEIPQCYEDKSNINDEDYINISLTPDVINYDVDLDKYGVIGISIENVEGIDTTSIQEIYDSIMENIVVMKESTIDETAVVKGIYDYGDGDIGLHLVFCVGEKCYDISTTKYNETSNKIINTIMKSLKVM